jgi:hypothetical protein
VGAAEEAFVGGGGSPARTGGTIAERRAAAEKARRESLLSEPGDGANDAARPVDVTGEPESAGDARTGRKDA